MTNEPGGLRFDVNLGQYRYQSTWFYEVYMAEAAF